MQHFRPEAAEYIAAYFNFDEEPASPFSYKHVFIPLRRELTRSYNQGLEVLVAEFENAGPGGAVKRSRRGLSRYKITFNGKRGHSGENVGVNAIAMQWELGKMIARWQKHHPAATINPTLIDGGVEINTMPPYCNLSLDCRFTSDTDQRSFDNLIRTAVHKHPALDYTIDTHPAGVYYGPMSAEVSQVPYQQLVHASQQTLRFDAPPEAWDAPASSDANWFSTGVVRDRIRVPKLKIPTLAGLGLSGKGDHDVLEEANIDEFVPLLVRTPALLINMLSLERQVDRGLALAGAISI